jgi:hypothetical protein
LPSPSGQHTQIGRQRLAKALSVLGLVGRTLVPHSRALQPDNEEIVKVADKVSGHLTSMGPWRSITMDSGMVKLDLGCAIALPAARLC